MIHNYNHRKTFFIRRFTAWMAIATLPLSTSPVSYANAGQIIIDGKSQTHLDIRGNVTDITTKTIHKSSGINSFRKFDVHLGNEVNLHVPKQASNLVNIVNGGLTSHIDGTLNAYKNGQIGGNVYFLNPHGTILGAEGTMNVGSLTLMAPTEEYVENFFQKKGVPRQEAMDQLMKHEVPISSSALITIEGAINARDRVEIRSHDISVSGEVNAGASAKALAAIDMDRVVNLENLNVASEVVVNSDGTIDLVAGNDVTLSGTLSVSGKSERPSAQAGEIFVRAQRDIALEKGAHLLARGKGARSHGGRIEVYADREARFETGATIDVTGGDISGDGGFAELSAKKTVHLNGGLFKAFAQNGAGGAILIDPEDISITSDQLFHGGDYELQATNSITIAEGVLISTRMIGEGGNQESDASIGDSGDVTFRAPHISLEDDTALYAHGTGGFLGGDIIFSASSSGNTSIIVNDATIKGKDITFTASSDTSSTLQGENPISNAFASILLAPGATLDASGDIALNASSLQDAPNFNNGLFDARDAKSQLVLNGARLTAGGGVNISSSSSLTTDLGSWFEGLLSPLSFLVASTDSTARTTLQGDTRISAGGSVAISSQAITQSTVAAQATSGLVGATVAISDIKNQARTEVKGRTDIQSEGSVRIVAQGKALVDTSSDASAIGSSGGAFAIAVGSLDADIQAILSEGATVRGNGGIALQADSLNQVKNTSRAGISDAQSAAQDQLGGLLESANIDSGLITELQGVLGEVLGPAIEKLSGEGGGSSVQLAGALSIANIESATEASLQGNESKTIQTEGLLDIKSRSVLHGTNLASGIAGEAAYGGGAGIAIQVVNHDNRAFASGSEGQILTLESEGLSIKALTESFDPETTEENSNVFASLAYSGQGGGDVGLAGALSVNLVKENKVQAFLGPHTLAQLGGGDLTVTASSSTQTQAVADGTPDEEESAGLDALFALYGEEEKKKRRKRRKKKKRKTMVKGQVSESGHPWPWTSLKMKHSPASMERPSFKRPKTSKSVP